MPSPAALHMVRFEAGTDSEGGWSQCLRGTVTTLEASNTNSPALVLSVQLRLPRVTASSEQAATTEVMLLSRRGPIVSSHLFLCHAFEPLCMLTKCLIQCAVYCGRQSRILSLSLQPPMCSVAEAGQYHALLIGSARHVTRDQGPRAAVNGNQRAKYFVLLLAPSRLANLGITLQGSQKIPFALLQLSGCPSKHVDKSNVTLHIGNMVTYDGAMLCQPVSLPVYLGGLFVSRRSSKQLGLWCQMRQSIQQR